MNMRISIEELAANQRFLARELIARGAEVRLVDYDNQVLEVRIGGHRELLVDIDSTAMPYAASVIAGSKPITKALLAEAGISVPRGGQFLSDEVEEAIVLAEIVGFPVVVKPSLGVQGKGVCTDVTSPAELRHAMAAVEHLCGFGEVLIEEQFEAREYRVLINRNGDYAVTHRDPAYVVGDGRHSIEELAVIESSRRMNPRTSCLSTLVIDEEVSRFLRRAGLSLSYVPGSGEKVYLRRCSNLMLGGFAEDVTDLVHPSVIEISRAALACIPGLPYAGIDFMSVDITSTQSTESYRILELNSLPGIGMHLAPGRGESRNSAAIIADMIFPETRGGASVLRRAA
jgi:cyanophycin synthetase